MIHILITLRETEPAMLMKHGSWMPHGRTAPVARRLASHVATLPRSRQRCSTVMEAAEKDLQFTEGFEGKFGKK